MNAPNFKRDECPNCGYKVDSATEFNGCEEGPEEGDFSLCLNCGQLMRFNEQLNLINASPEDWSKLDTRQFMEIKKAQAYIQRRGAIA